MPNRGRVVNKLALVILSIVVLELVLIGDQVQPIKGIKKKIYLKKLKKILPLLALVKPKKKLILVPIPIPMFSKQPMDMMPMMDSYDMQMDYGQQQQQQSYSGGSGGGAGGYSQESNQGGGGGGGY